MRKLLEFRRSPNCVKVRIALRLKGLDFDTEEMMSADRAPLIEAAAWPLVPVLIDGDVAMRDSMAILHYLEANYREPSLSLLDADELRAAEKVESELTDSLRPIMNELFQLLRQDEAERDMSELPQLNRRARRAIEPLEGRLDGGEYLFADRPTIYDIVCACNLMGMRPPAQFVEESPMWRAASKMLVIPDNLAGVRRWYDALMAVDGLSA